jgi:hypothetical protein
MNQPKRPSATGVTGSHEVIFSKPLCRAGLPKTYDQVIPLNQFHLRRLGREYLAYYHQDRTHVGLDKNTPDKRVVEGRSSPQSRVVSKSRLGGLHHRYRWLEAA